MDKQARIGAKRWADGFGSKSATTILRQGDIPGAKSDVTIYNERVLNCLREHLSRALPKLKKLRNDVKTLAPLVQAEASEQVDLYNSFFDDLENQIRAGEISFTDSWMAAGETVQIESFNAARALLLKQAEADKTRRQALVQNCSRLQEELDSFIPFIENGVPTGMQPWDYVASTLQKMSSIHELVRDHYSYEHHLAAPETKGICGWIEPNGFDHLAGMFSSHSPFSEVKPYEKSPFFVLCKKHGIFHNRFIPEMKHYAPHYININASDKANKFHANAFKPELIYNLLDLHRAISYANEDEMTRSKLGTGKSAA